MTIKISDTLKNARLDAISTTYGASAKLRLYSGTEPADESTALSGNTMLIEFTLAPAAAAAGSKQMVPSTLSGPAAAGGAGTNATFYRVYNSAGSVCYEQGSITATGGGGDMTLDNVNIATGQTVNVTSWQKNEPG